MAKGEWTVNGLARELDMPAITLYSWLRKRWVKASKRKGPHEPWVIRANQQEVERLRELKNAPHHRWPRRPGGGSQP